MLNKHTPERPYLNLQAERIVEKDIILRQNQDVQVQHEEYNSVIDLNKHYENYVMLYMVVTEPTICVNSV